MDSLGTLGRDAAKAAFKRLMRPFQSPDRTRLLPLSSAFFGPPRRVERTPSYCLRNRYRWIEVYPPQKVARRNPVCINYPAQQALELVHDWRPPAGLAFIPQARVVSAHGWIVGPDDTFVPDHSWFGVAPNECPIYRANHLRQGTLLPGRTLTLASDWAVSNYGHTLLDALSRVALVEAAGISWHQIDRVIVPDLRSDGRRTLAKLAGIPSEKIVNVTSFRVARCETLIAPTFPGLRRESPEWVPRFWRAKAGAGTHAKRRLYISRQGQARAVKNENEVTSLLRTFGFEIVVPGTGAVHQHFQDAAVVIGVHGAALADVAFCSPGSVLIELTPSRHVYPYYYTAADAAGMRFISILSPSDELERDSVRAGIHVPIDVLSRAVEEVMLSLEGS